MKLIAEIDGERLDVELRREGGRVLAEVGGRRYEVEAREVEPGVMLLVGEGGRVCEVHFGEGGAGAWRVRAGSGGRASTYEVSLIDPRRLRASAGAAGQDGGRAQLAAAMPGKVVRVLVAEGQQVEAGEGVVVVEAMKMQNEMKSPRAGTVVELRAQPGATVNAGDVLAVIE